MTSHTRCLSPERIPRDAVQSGECVDESWCVLGGFNVVEKRETRRGFEMPSRILIGHAEGDLTWYRGSVVSK